jgi:Zn finger protein HypA/HybF involved in hydrogenase expression
MKIEEAIQSMKNYKPTEVESAKIAVEALEKQVSKKAKYDGYNIESDSHNLICPNCYVNVGSLDNEDGDGKYKFNLYVKHCPSCGQKIKQIYTEEDYKDWGL